MFAYEVIASSSTLPAQLYYHLLQTFFFCRTDGVYEKSAFHHRFTLKRKKGESGGEVW
jgi:hypothetical protein